MTSEFDQLARGAAADVRRAATSASRREVSVTGARTTTRNPLLRPALAFATVAALAAGAFVITRDRTPGEDQAPPAAGASPDGTVSSTAVPSTAPWTVVVPPDGLSSLQITPFVLDPAPDGLHPTSVTDTAFTTDERYRIYATDSQTPEADPWLWVMHNPTVNSGFGWGNEDPAVDVMVNGRSAVLVEQATGVLELFLNPDFPVEVNSGDQGAFATVLLRAHGIDRDTLVRLGASITSSDDGFGMLIDPSLLPAGVTQQARSIPSYDSAVVPLGSISASVTWEDSGTRLVGLSWFDDPDGRGFRATRLMYPTVIDTPVRGGTGYVASFRPDNLVLIWHEDERTFVMPSYPYNAASLVALATTVRPATMDEWQALHQAADAASDSPTVDSTAYATIPTVPEPAPTFDTSAPAAARPTLAG